MEFLSIGEFAGLSRLSPKALRLYDRLELLLPARVDSDSGYRFYEFGQVERARLISSLRQIGVTLAEIRLIVALEPEAAAEHVIEFWAATEAEHTARRALAAYLIDDLSGKRSVMYEVSTRDVPERALLCLKRNVAGDQAWAFGKEFIALLRHHRLPQIPGRAGAFFCIYWGEVSEDSDGPLEWCRPVPPDEAEVLAVRCRELTLRAEPAHQEVFVKLGANGEIDGAEWQLVEQSLHAWSEEQPDVRLIDLGLRITYLASEAAQESYSDVAVPFNGQSRG